MGVHNGERTLERAIGSVLRQTVGDFEFIICDDGSTDGTWELLQRYARTDQRVIPLRNQRNMGLAGTLNVCLQKAQGDFIARMDDDDFSHPDRFEKQLRALEEHPEIAFAGSNACLRRCGLDAGVRILPAFPEPKDFYFVQPFIHPALLFRREALEAIGGYSEDSRQLLCEDYDLLLRLYAKQLRGMNVQECLLDYTISDTARGNRKMIHRWNEAVTRYDRFRDLGLLPGALPYVVKPILTGLLPEAILRRLKTGYQQPG